MLRIPRRRPQPHILILWVGHRRCSQTTGGLAPSSSLEERLRVKPVDVRQQTCLILFLLLLRLLMLGLLLRFFGLEAGLVCRLLHLFVCPSGLLRYRRPGLCRVVPHHPLRSGHLAPHRQRPLFGRVNHLPSGALLLVAYRLLILFCFLPATHPIRRGLEGVVGPVEVAALDAPTVLVADDLGVEEVRDVERLEAIPQKLVLAPWLPRQVPACVPLLVEINVHSVPGHRLQSPEERWPAGRIWIEVAIHQELGVAVAVRR
mmetsp:Transcript_100045/g.322464  ORF Transcript_100045/g.322464 Transcript_100045/m.322464 type:complete len:260 (+) Transcript_100045:1115-1894(+)